MSTPPGTGDVGTGVGAGNGPAVVVLPLRLPGAGVLALAFGGCAAMTAVTFSTWDSTRRGGRPNAWG